MPIAKSSYLLVIPFRIAKANPWITYPAYGPT